MWRPIIASENETPFEFIGFDTNMMESRLWIGALSIDSASVFYAVETNRDASRSS